MKKIIFDVMSGETGYKIAIKAALKFANDFPNSNIILVGSKKAFDEFKELPKNIEVINSTQVITMEDSNPLVYRTKKDSSMSIGLKNLRNGNAHAMYSCANTGAYLTASFLQSKPINNKLRPALTGFVKPYNKTKVILDLGAVIDCDENNLVDFAKMGQIYSSILTGIKNPKSALIQNGTEDHKGSKVTKAAFKLFKEDKAINFFGNIEAKQLFTTEADVLIADGFTGNQILKTVEGTMKFASYSLKKAIKKNPFRMLIAFLGKSIFTDFKNDLVTTAKAGGAVMLGLNHIVVKSPGSSDFETMYNGLVLTNKLLQEDLVGKIKKKVL